MDTRTTGLKTISFSLSLWQLKTLAHWFYVYCTAVLAAVASRLTVWNRLSTFLSCLILSLLVLLRTILRCPFSRTTSFLAVPQQQLISAGCLGRIYCKYCPFGGVGVAAVYSFRRSSLMSSHCVKRFSHHKCMRRLRVEDTLDRNVDNEVNGRLGQHDSYAVM